MLPPPHAKLLCMVQAHTHTRTSQGDVGCPGRGVGLHRHAQPRPTHPQQGARGVLVHWVDAVALPLGALHPDEPASGLGHIAHRIRQLRGGGWTRVQTHKLWFKGGCLCRRHKMVAALPRAARSRRLGGLWGVEDGWYTCGEGGWVGVGKGAREGGGGGGCGLTSMPATSTALLIPSSSLLRYVPSSNLLRCVGITSYLPQVPTYPTAIP